MKQNLSDDMLAKLSTHIAEQMGLHFPDSKRQSLEQGFCRAARELDFQDPMECAAWFVSAPPSRELMETMACYLTVGETYFLRESKSFEIMEQEIIPELVRTRQGGERRLRIWSAGCATGEEPYSIAISLQRMSALLKGWEIFILATDINSQALAKASEGLYSEWSFRNPPKGFREKYFQKIEGGRFELDPRIRRMVSFSSLNLAEDLYPSLINNTNAMDMIFCRNVLMYFTPQRAAKVIERFQRCLVERGLLFVSPCEASSLLSSRFRAMSCPDAYFYRKLEPGLEAWGSGLGARGSGLGARGSGLGAQGSGLGAQGLPAVNFKPMEPVYPAPIHLSRDIQTQALVSKSSTFTPPTSKTAPDPPPAPLTPYDDAMALYVRGLFTEAAERLTLYLSTNSGDAASFALLCRIRANEGKLGDALRLSEQAIAADRVNAGMQYLRGVILQELGEIEAAVTTLKRALYLDQELVLAHYSLGNLALRLGKEKDSRRYFDNTLALLKRYRPDEIVPESEGMLAGRLMEIIESAAGKADSFIPDKGSRKENRSAETRRFIR